MKLETVNSFKMKNILRISSNEHRNIRENKTETEINTETEVRLFISIKFPS
jgi:hypothetical protein